jgi:hypothetical protein
MNRHDAENARERKEKRKTEAGTSEELSSVKF